MAKKKAKKEETQPIVTPPPAPEAKKVGPDGKSLTPWADALADAKRRKFPATDIAQYEAKAKEEAQRTKDRELRQKAIEDAQKA